MYVCMFSFFFSFVSLYRMRLNGSSWNFHRRFLPCPYIKFVLENRIRFRLEQRRFEVRLFCGFWSIRWWFPEFFRPDGHRMRRWPRRNSFEHCTTFESTESAVELVRIDRQRYLLTIFKLFSARWTPNATLTTYKQFEHCTISGSTESGPNRSPEPSADDFDIFLTQMNAECDVDRVETVLNIVRFADPPNRPSNRYWIHDQGNPQAGGLT